MLILIYICSLVCEWTVELLNVTRDTRHKTKAKNAKECVIEKNTPQGDLHASTHTYISKYLHLYICMHRSDMVFI